MMNGNTGVRGSPNPGWPILAQRILAQVPRRSWPEQWGLLTALNNNVKHRHGGPYIVLHKRAHVLGCRVEEEDYRFASLFVSGTHCTITRKILTIDGEVKSLDVDAVVGDEQCTFIEDLSAYGTFLDAKRVRISDPTIRLEHGAMLSLAGSPDNYQAFAFVYQEVPPDIYGENEVCMKDYCAAIVLLAAGVAVDGQPIVHNKRKADTGRGLGYRIPGPAGALEAEFNSVRTTRNGCLTNIVEQYRCFDRPTRIVQAIDDSLDFKQGPWLAAMEYFDNMAICNQIDNSVVETTKPNGYGDMQVTLKDPTGKIEGTIHRKVLTGLEDRKLIKPESVLVIRRVAVFSPTPFRHYLNITINNVKKSDPDSRFYAKESETSKGKALEVAVVPQHMESIKSNNCISFEDDGIDWEAELAKDLELYWKCTRMPRKSNVSIGSNMSGN
ncbi:unnamed protein product [Calypogeia fissa]